MAKISGQPNETSPSTSDYVLGNSTTGPTTKRFTFANLITLFFNNIPNAIITRAKLSTTVGELGGAWTTWVPTYVNFTAGDGTLTYARYIKIGKTVFFRIRFVLGSTSAVTGGIQFSLPSTTHASYFGEPLGMGYISDTGTRTYVSSCVWSDSTHAAMVVHPIVATYLDWAGTAANKPMTWVAGDIWAAQGSYEEA